MTWRQLRVLIQNLPGESATMTALRNALTDEELAAQADTGEPEKGRWSQLEQLVAANLDASRRIEYVLRCANSEKKDHPEPPEPIRRPGAKAKPSKKALSEKSADRLFQLINGGGGE
ncbi:hypothetical protein ABT010_13505 [Streptomyces sp. NPDC002668]|uniref:hypothetical protein n=1 Tax=Streptomyces sp. NPDC002668 TaxID=3154422 RepID=UPI00332732B5